MVDELSSDRQRMTYPPASEPPYNTSTSPLIGGAVVESAACAPGAQAADTILMQHFRLTHATEVLGAVVTEA